MFIPEPLYKKIISVMPISCVDLLVTDTQGKILLLKRKYEPARGQWWFPGGRVHFGETRRAAAIRKLKEECGLVARGITELGTFDIILEIQKKRDSSHGISTLYLMEIKKERPFVLDSQSLEAGWRTPIDWMKEDLHIFVNKMISDYCQLSTNSISC